MAFTTLRAVSMTSSKLVVISKQPVAFRRWLKHLCPEVVALDSSRWADWKSRADSAARVPFDIAVVILEGNECANLAPWLERARALLKPGALLGVLLTTDLDDVFDRQSRGLDASLLPMSVSSEAGVRLRNMRHVPKTRARSAIAAAMTSVAKAIRLRPLMALPLAPVVCILVLASLACNGAALLRHPEPHDGSICSSVFLLMDVQAVRAVREGAASIK